MKTMKGLVSKDPKAVAEGRIVSMRLELAYVLRTLREKSHLSQAEVGKLLGINQPAIAKLENPMKPHELESVVRLLSALDADLLMAVRHNNRLYQINEDVDGYIVDVPHSAKAQADLYSLSCRDYVHQALESYNDYIVEQPSNPPWSKKQLKKSPMAKVEPLTEGDTYLLSL